MGIKIKTKFRKWKCMEMEQIVLPFGQGDQGGSSGVGEETKGGRQGWVRRPRGLVRGG